MPQKFIQLEAAAELLGISKEKLNSLREQGRAHAYRDGMSWKFKEEEVERIRENLDEILSDKGESSGINLDLAAAGGSGVDLEPAGDALDLDPGDGDDSILLSEVELGESQKGPSSTVIGKHEAGLDEGSDVKLARPAKSSGSDVLLAGSDILLDAPTASSDVHAAPEAAKKQPAERGGKGSDLGKQFEDIEELDFDLEATSSGITKQKSGGSAAGKSDLLLGDEGLALSPLSSVGKSAAGKSNILSQPLKPVGKGGSDVQLGADEDDELVLGDVTSGSDITLNSGDSGIGITAASDSGISLDEPLALGGSAVESLELGEDDAITLEEESDGEGATMLRGDDDFLLTPLDDAGGEDGDDSGSQVIALDSESFDESQATLLGSGQPLQQAAMMGGAMGGLDPSLMGGRAMGMSAAGVGEIPEAPYTLWNIISLVLCIVMLALTGMMLFDLIRNMWSWDKPYQYNSTIMDSLMDALPIFPKK